MTRQRCCLATSSGVAVTHGARHHLEGGEGSAQDGASGQHDWPSYRGGRRKPDALPPGSLPSIRRASSFEGTCSLGGEVSMGVGKFIELASLALDELSKVGSTSRRPRHRNATRGQFQPGHDGPVRIPCGPMENYSGGVGLGSAHSTMRPDCSTMSVSTASTVP